MTYQDYLKEQIAIINDKFKNTFLNKIQALTKTDFLFGFSQGKDNSVFISIMPQEPFITITNHKFLVNNNNQLINKIKAKLNNSKFIGASLINEDNIVKFEFMKTTDTYDKIPFTLIIELFKMNTNIVLLDQDNKIIEALKYHGLDTKHPIIQNANFEYPLNSIVTKEVPSNYIESINNHIEQIEDRYLEEKYKYVLVALKAKKKSLQKKLKVIVDEENEAKEKLVYKDYGDFFLANLGNMVRGDNSFDYYGTQINIKANSTPQQNLEYLYKVYKKAKQTIQMSSKFIEETEDDLNYVSSLLDSTTFFNEEDYLQLIEELKSTNIIKIKTQKNVKIQKSAVKPYYILFNGVKIGYGKNNIQNDYLTFKLANKTDYFLHIDKTHGPHVVIFDSNPTNEVKELASEIAIYLAKKNTGEVMFAQVKFIKKMGTLGKVKIANYETFHIINFKFDIKNVLLDSKRF
jgi:predicted ribosome quality control (RQC) complex YloA/Tae2 family protein